MGNANGEVTQAEYIRYVEITIPATGSPATLWSLIEGKLTDEEKLRVIQILIKDHGAEFVVGEESDLSGKNETVEATGVYTEPCLGDSTGWLGKTYVAAVGAAPLTPLCKVYIGQARNQRSLT